VILEALPERLRQDAFIAGGYAACPALASDIDIWVHCGVEQISVVHDEIIAYLKSVYGGWNVTEEPFAEAAFDYIDTGDGQCTVRKCAVVKMRSTSLHIMITDAWVHTILDNFDISTHMVAILPSGEVIKGAAWTPIYAPPIVVKDTPRTAARLDKILKRYRIALETA